jgi:hypothetical protein
LETTLKDMGLGSIVTTNAFKDLSKQAQECAGAIDKVDLASFTEKFRELQKLVGDIQTGEVGRKMDADVYNELIANNKELAKDFVMNNDGSYTYLGDNMQLLASAIIENTETQRNNNIGQI